jgi:formyltetrahydrofolate deformylase
MLVLVSQHGHCLNDLLYPREHGGPAREIPAVVSNHEAFRELVESRGIPFHHVPVTAATKAEAEGRILELVREQRGRPGGPGALHADPLGRPVPGAAGGRDQHPPLVPAELQGRAAPTTRRTRAASSSSGATAHYVTADLDEGPIIEQEVARVDHSYTPDRLAAVGRDLEAMALARAVGWHLDHRVLLNGQSTVVFR